MIIRQEKRIRVIEAFVSAYGDKKESEQEQVILKWYVDLRKKRRSEKRDSENEKHTPKDVKGVNSDDPTYIPFGNSFLHTHPKMEKVNQLDVNHVIIDREDWEIAVSKLNPLLINP